MRRPLIVAALVVAALVVTALVATAAPAFAQEAHEKSSLLTPHGGLMAWTLVVFVALFLVLGKFAFGPITAAVERREKALEDALAFARKDRDDAAKLLEEHRKRIESARGEAQRFIAEGRAAAEAMRGEMLEQTRQQQQELLQRARRDIESEKSKAIDVLRREAVDLAIAGASKVIERNLDDAGNRRLVERYLAGIEAR
ncbi:MAG TPA: F0F1 ATP synthase subunit B [Gemmatimonadaceae bacterium]|nr:F0F1 ATP synthase subunit B [Gemmatimonadaceae bacterium]